jgi:hypothetical protein
MGGWLGDCWLGALVQTGSRDFGQENKTVYFLFCDKMLEYNSRVRMLREWCLGL